LTYLGLVVVLHGILIGFDTALAGEPPTPETKRFGRTGAFLGAALAAISVVAAYALEWRHRSIAAKLKKGVPLDLA
jgi:hypothetical protein